MEESKNKKSFRVISKNDIAILIKNTEAKNRSWDRICLHSNSNAKMHSMIMCMLGNIESGFHLNKNSTDIITYSYLGYPFQVKIMEEINSGIIEIINIDKLNPIISIEDSTMRCLKNNSSQTIVYLEQRAGPYIKEEIVWLD